MPERVPGSSRPFLASPCARPPAVNTHKLQPISLFLATTTQQLCDVCILTPTMSHFALLISHHSNFRFPKIYSNPYVGLVHHPNMLPILHVFPGPHDLPAMFRMESGLSYIQDKCSQRGRGRGLTFTPAPPKLIILLFEVLREVILCVFLREIELR